MWCGQTNRMEFRCSDMALESNFGPKRRPVDWGRHAWMSTFPSHYTLASQSIVWRMECSWDIRWAVVLISNTKQAKSGDKMQFSWVGIRLTSGYSSYYKSILVISVLIAICDLYCWVGNAYNQACTVWDTRGSSVQVSHFITTSCAAPWCKLCGIRGKEYFWANKYRIWNPFIFIMIQFIRYW